MKKLFFIAIVVVTCVGFSSCLNSFSSPSFDIREASRGEVCFLKSASCAQSITAEKYIKETYPNVNIKFIELDESAEDFDADKAEKYSKSACFYYGLGKSFDTPLICFWKNYVEGWSNQNKEKIDLWIEPYLKGE